MSTRYTHYYQQFNHITACVLWPVCLHASSTCMSHHMYCWVCVPNSVCMLQPHVHKGISGSQSITFSGHQIRSTKLAHPLATKVYTVRYSGLSTHTPLTHVQLIHVFTEDCCFIAWQHCTAFGLQAGSH